MLVALLEEPRVAGPELGGDVDVASTVGGGTTVSFHLPLAAKPDA